MKPEMTPNEVRRAQFKTSLRGLDRSQVEAFLSAVADHLEELESENEKLSAAAGEITDRDLSKEFELVGQEVSSILQSAREAADSIRERAAVDAARWRSEAMEESETARREAAADAEALRRDAWATGSELLEQATEASRKMREEAERDVLTIQGEAEREAHRLTSAARREAEDLVRSATMDADKTTADATKRRDEIIDQANRQAAAAQERTRALEQRRDELMEELENVRSTLTRLEGSLEEKRETLDLSSEESTSVRVIPTARTTEEGESWEPGETVRVVKPEDRGLPGADTDFDVEDLVPRRPAVVKAPEAPTPAPPEEEEPPLAPAESEEAADAVTKKVAERSGSDEVGALFDSLRGGGHAEQAEPEPPVEQSPDDRMEDDNAEQAESHDWIEVRDARLLPITNRALRGAKKSLTELQNIALDGIRTDEKWRPTPEVIAESLHAELVAVWAESFAAGHNVAEEMTDSKIKRPPTPATDLAPEFAKALAEAISVAIDEAGEGQRARQAAVSRVFRVWRADEAERRIREMGIHAFDIGVERSVGVETPV